MIAYTDLSYFCVQDGWIIVRKNQQFNMSDEWGRS